MIMKADSGTVLAYRAPSPRPVKALTLKYSDSTYCRQDRGGRGRGASQAPGRKEAWGLLPGGHAVGPQMLRAPLANTHARLCVVLYCHGAGTCVPLLQSRAVPMWRCIAPHPPPPPFLPLPSPAPPNPRRPLHRARPPAHLDDGRLALKAQQVAPHPAVGRVALLAGDEVEEAGRPVGGEEHVLQVWFRRWEVVSGLGVCRSAGQSGRTGQAHKGGAGTCTRTG